MAEDFDPVDVSKRQYIENVVEPDMHTAISQLAKARKKMPLKCVKQARKVANNNIYYCGKSCVVLETEQYPVRVDSSEVDKVFEINGVDEVPTNLNTLSKLITSYTEERQELVKAHRLLNQKLASSFESDNNIKNRPLVSPNFYSDDFIVDESAPLID
ncbi:hypothetical protein EGW08_006766 [Elysia chlorotica]|uniref:Uncharacterized protein n=1 Tax=Elysia chlorotica TaxID=188477 RepID=A0A3S1A8P2_ELYCH|nr:hypothetical protein EGW08_006766 [Elysia chlorotica]